MHKDLKPADDKLWPIIQKSLKQFNDVLQNYIKKERDQLVVLSAIEVSLLLLQSLIDPY